MWLGARGGAARYRAIESCAGEAIVNITDADAARAYRPISLRSLRFLSFSFATSLPLESSSIPHRQSPRRTTADDDTSPRLLYRTAEEQRRLLPFLLVPCAASYLPCTDEEDQDDDDDEMAKVAQRGGQAAPPPPQASPPPPPGSYLPTVYLPHMSDLAAPIIPPKYMCCLSAKMCTTVKETAG